MVIHIYTLDHMKKVDKIKYPDVKQEYRFELQEIKSVKEN
jgi:hypothetical protein